MLSSAQLREAFDSLDTDRSGLLEFVEVAALTKKLGQPVDKVSIENIFKTIDTNSDGKLTFEEFLAWYRVGRTTKMGQLIKTHLEVQKGFRTVSQKMKGENQAGLILKNVATLLDFEIHDGEASQGKSFFGLHMLSGANNTKAPEFLQKHVEDYDATQTYVYVSLRCKNGEPVKKAVLEFWEAALALSEEMGEEVASGLRKLNFSVSSKEGLVTVSIALNGSEMLQVVPENINAMKDKIEIVKPAFLVSLQSDMTLKEVLINVYPL